MNVNSQKLTRTVFVDLVYSALMIFAHHTFSQTKINIEIIFTGIYLLENIFFDLKFSKFMLKLSSEQRLNFIEST